MARQAARRVSLLRRLTQYLQSNTQLLVINTFSRVMHRPSAEKLWQQPAIEEVVLPIIPGRALRLTPLEVQAASYLAASVRMAQLIQQLHAVTPCGGAAGGDPAGR